MLVKSFVEKSSIAHSAAGASALVPDGKATTCCGRVINLKLALNMRQDRLIPAHFSM
jgi:hypothetical protein